MSRRDTLDATMPVFAAMEKKSEASSFEKHRVHVSIFLERCRIVAIQHGEDRFDGDVGTVLPVIARHGEQVYGPVLDAIAAFPVSWSGSLVAAVPRSSSGGGLVESVEAFLYLCGWLKANATPDASELVRLVDGVTEPRIRVRLLKERQKALDEALETAVRRVNEASQEIKGMTVKLGHLLSAARDGTAEAHEAASELKRAQESIRGRMVESLGLEE